MIHGCHIGRGSIVEPGAIVCDGSVIGAESWSAPVPASSSATVSATGPSWTASRPDWSAPSPARRCRAGPCPRRCRNSAQGATVITTVRVKKGERCLSR